MRVERSGEFRWAYSVAELWADGIVHVLGLTLTVVGAVVMLWMLAGRTDVAGISAAGIYLATLGLSIGASAAYNIWPVSRTKWLLRRLDHSAIFLLIAGTYTPFMIQMGKPWMLAAVWAVAGLGVFLKLYRPGRYDRLAIVLYLALGWSGVATWETLLAELSGTVLTLIVAGGLVYSFGVAFHVWERLRYQNAIWHGFVVVAASIHYAAVWQSLGA